MLPGLRILKRFLIAILFFALVGSGAFFGARAIHEPTPTPTPDPTRALQPIEILETYLLKVGESDYDFLAKVRNPNSNFGSPQVTYEITFLDATEAMISQNTGTFYILPGQVKYILQTPLSLDSRVSKATVKILSVQWHALDVLAIQGINFVVTGETYRNISDGAVFSKLNGSVLNNSDFDVGNVDIVTVVMDLNGTPLAINRSEIRTFLAHTTRGFEMTWFAPFLGEVKNTVTEAYVNLFENNTFIRTYGGSERFQQFE